MHDALHKLPVARRSLAAVVLRRRRLAPRTKRTAFFSRL
jgi:hypothetical protein